MVQKCAQLPVGAAKDFRGLAVAGAGSAFSVSVGRQLGPHPQPLYLHDPGDPKRAVLRVFRLRQQSLRRVRSEGLPPFHRRIRHAHGCLCGALDHSSQHGTDPLGGPGERPHRCRRGGPHGACTALNPFTDIAYGLSRLDHRPAPRRGTPLWPRCSADRGGRRPAG